MHMKYYLEETANKGWTFTSFLPLIMIGLLVVVFFFMYRGNKKQEREAQNMRNSLEVGDEITTIGGIVGEIVKINEETIVIETTANKTKIKLLRSAIRNVDVSAAAKRGEVPMDNKEEPKDKTKKKDEANSKIEKEKPVEKVEEKAENTAEVKDENATEEKADN